jgi:hypothetical protein
VKQLSRDEKWRNDAMVAWCTVMPVFPHFHVMPFLDGLRIRPAVVRSNRISRCALNEGSAQQHK